MGSTADAERKRRHFSSISPTAPTAKKNSLVPFSEERKLDAAVLQFQNQKLTQRLEVQKVEIAALGDKFHQLKDKQQSYEKTLTVIDNAWEQLIDDLGSCSNQMRDFVNPRHDGDLPPVDAYLRRLTETGATESSSGSMTSKLTEDDRKIDDDKAKKTDNIMHNILASINDLADLKNRLYSLKGLSNEQSLSELMNSRTEVAKLHLKHKSLAGELQGHRDIDAKNKAELRQLKGELESTIAELEESNRNLEILKAERDLAKRAIFPVLNRGNKQVTSDKSRDKQRDLQEVESVLKELMDQSTSRLHELKRLHEDRLEILRRMSILQSNLKNIKSICSSQAYLLLKDQVAKAKEDAVQYQALYEKLQIEKESFFWREKESHMKNELLDVLHRSSAVADSRIHDLENEIQRYIRDKDDLENKLKEASKDPGRKEIIAEFKALVSSFPEKMASMQTELAKHKEAAANIHGLRANVQSLTNILERKVNELKTLTSRTDHQNAEIKKLEAMVHELEVTNTDLKLFVDMYGHESTDSREIAEAKRSEMKAWAEVQSLKAALDERNLESRVKVAIAAEAKSQQKLAATEAEIAELRKKLQARKREKAKLSDVLKSKNEETEAYSSEIETIGQAYDDMQTQNQQLLQQITERDDYNTKLVLEGVRARQAGDALLREKRTLEKAVQQNKTTVDLYNFKAGRIEDQMKAHKDHAHRVAEARAQKTVARDNTHRRLLEITKARQQMRDTLETSQSKVESSRVLLSEQQVKLEKERFDRKRVEEELETLRRKAEELKSQADGGVAEKLKQDLTEYKDILKCSVCQDKRKEVVITKCYHLFCSPCVQKLIDTRHRKCPTCAASFGVNDVKPIYI